MPIKVACVTDRDLRPDIVGLEKDEEESGVKYVRMTANNKKRFESYYDGSTEEKKIDNFLKNKKVNDGQNVKTFISPRWTLEYDIAYSGLREEMHQAIDPKTPFDDIKTGTDEEVAAKIYKPLYKSRSKSESAYRLAKILEDKYWDEGNNKPKDTEELKGRLPEYLLQMYEHVTGKKLTSAVKQDD